MPASRLRLGVDTGGTFTDAVIMNEETGDFNIDKVPSTPADPALSFHRIVSDALSTTGASADDISYLVHGTTVATNCIIEGKTARCALLTTSGFRDILEIARQIKPEPYNIFFDKPRPLVPRNLCLEIPERLDYEGNTVTPLDREAVLGAARQLRQEGVSSIATCFLHSYRNPIHEKMVEEILTRELPEVHVSISSEICPEFREYFRASTTIVNAAIAPIVAGYLNRMESRLKSLGFAQQLSVMQSNGGICTSEIARRKPVHLVESGPAAGVIVAAHIGMLSGSPHVISLDIGGTTAKAGLIQDGKPTVCSEFEVGSKATGRRLNTKATGYPIKSSVLDLVEIGAGGGSIAWVDPGGALRVGPQSAGAEPGPACYERGGSLPTLTDANLLLGRINPDYFLGGRMPLSVGAAREAIDREIASKLGLSAVEAACGMIEIANSNMIEALRLISVQRGFDPREFALVAFGGAGPLHANAIAAMLGIPKVIIPLSPGISSALGLLLADIKHDLVRTYIRKIHQADCTFLDLAFAGFESDGRRMLSREGIPESRQTFHREADLRYAGQSFELKIRFPDGPVTAASLATLEAEFHRSHEQAYGHSSPGEPVEIVNLRLIALGSIPKPRPPRIAQSTNGQGAVHKANRPVCFEPDTGYVPVPVYDRYRLTAQTVLEGPAIIEEFDSTVVLHPGYAANVDEFGSIQITQR